MSINPTAVATVLAVAAVPVYHLLVKKPAPPQEPDKPPLRRRSSILEELTEVGTEVDLVLSFISVVATEAWTVFV